MEIDSNRTKRLEFVLANAYKDQSNPIAELTEDILNYAIKHNVPFRDIFHSAQERFMSAHVKARMETKGQ